MLCIHLFTLVKFVMYTVGMVVGAAILIRPSGNWADDNKNGGILYLV